MVFEPLVRHWLPLITLMSCLAPAAIAGNGDAAAVAEARAWIARVQQAGLAGNYQGTLVLRIGDTMSSSRVTHFSVGDQTYEWLEALDGDRQVMLRHNDSVLTLRPLAKLATEEKREYFGAAVSTPQRLEPQALEQYELRREGAARLAGREAEVVLFEPRDLLRYAMRVWADLSSGLMLRADVLGLPPAQGAPRPVLESTAFSEAAIGLKAQPEVVLSALRNSKRLEGYRVTRLQLQRTTLEADGWELKRPVPGFRLAGCVRRSIERGSEAPVLQAVFTDGLTHVSLFVEPFKPLRHVAELRAQSGAAATVSRRRGDHWFTVVGDVPPATLKLFADAIERRP